ncbi:MAG: hypothetical protein ACLSGB_09380 [Dorea sp.]
MLSQRQRLQGDKIQVSVWVKKASSGNFTYDAIYIGSKDDEEKTPLVMESGRYRKGFGEVYF